MRWGPALLPAGQSAAGPYPIRMLLPTFPAPHTLLLLADRMRRGHRARNLRPGARLLCDSALFSRSGVSGMAAFRHTFQQAVLPLLAGLGQIVLRRATRETGLRRRALSRYADHPSDPAVSRAES